MIEKKGRRIVILVPYPAQGHLSPMQKVASAFVGMGLEAVIVVPQHIKRWPDEETVRWVAVEDGLSVGGGAAPDFFEIEWAMEKWMPSEVEKVVMGEKVKGEVICVVVDLLASWAIEVASTCGIPCAGFWPAMFASYRLISSIPHLLQAGLISHTGLPKEEGKNGIVSEAPIISTEDLPWLIGTVAAKKARFKFWRRSMERSRKLKWLLVNSFADERRVGSDSDLSSDPRVYPISAIIINSGGPGRHRRTISLWEEDRSCMEWLERQEARSVVYVSFGSWVSPIGEARVRSLALALEATGRPFLWVLRSTSGWREGLPAGFVERTSGRSRVVCWAPQTEILQHRSVGCYLTHCGWNSTLEALQFRVRLLCYPLAGDQFLNCAYIVQVWRVGVRLNGFGERDVDEGVGRVMQDEHMDARLASLHQAAIIAAGPPLLNHFLQQIHPSISIH
ncbi:UDP-glycosyltransferase 82A1 [Arachis stenosperma]|uniref:UDP-glycosyltransferase 82A1 n=1 Tax=Arachis stenosperma TaxID=217475 RepID=UPI0025AD9B1E|nr:UDP-glycosyltransferase 82A1 [Arachis stenosperma]